ncbi:MAG: SIMPL domain-containing protein, partial [Pseudomonadota bacterium]
IQPETTLSITSTASVSREPDLAYINAGVETQRETAADALAENAERMNGLFAALEEAGVEKRDIQTRNFNISPRYDYRNDQPPRLLGYTASNGVRAKITDLDNLGRTVDALVNAGGNTLDGISFALEDDSKALDAARKEAMAAALARAQLYADAAGYRVSRIVSIAEGGSRAGQPQSRVFEARSAIAGASASPVSAGELEFSATVTVLFELAK